MSARYDYNLSDFINSIDLERLNLEVKLIFPGKSFFITINSSANKVRVTFTVSLDGSEKTILGGIMANHNANGDPLRVNFFRVYPEIRKSSYSYWFTVATFTYLGSDRIGSINYIDVISKRQNSLSDYNLRVVDISKGKIICSVGNLDNDSYQLTSLGVISNVPSTESIMEVQVKTDNNQNAVFLQEIQVYYDN